MTRRAALLLLALAAVGAAVAYLFRDAWDDARVFRPVDYMEYYAAGRATLAGQNPYDGPTIYPYQVEVQAKLPPQAEGEAMTANTRYADPIMMWNPPWTLPLTFPLAGMHWRAGQVLWATANLLAVVVSAVLLWSVYGGRRDKLPLAVGVAIVFAPTIFLVLLGQISGFLLLGLAGFLYFQAPLSPGGRGVGGVGGLMAGLFAALTAIKPHLLLPFALVLLLQTLRGGRAWRTVIAGGLVLVLFGAIPLLWNPDVWSQYKAATAAEQAGGHVTLKQWVHPTLGFWLRTLHPDQPTALMFLPLLVTVPVVAGYWWVRRKAWSWPTELPRLVLASLITAPYGAWGFDLVLLLVPVMQAAGWVLNDRRLAVRAGFAGGFIGLNLLALLTLRWENSMANPWLTPAVVMGYLLAHFVCNASGMREEQVSPRTAVRGNSTEAGVPA